MQLTLEACFLLSKKRYPENGPVLNIQHSALVNLFIDSFNVSSILWKHIYEVSVENDNNFLMEILYIFKMITKICYIVINELM